MNPNRVLDVGAYLSVSLISTNPSASLPKTVDATGSIWYQYIYTLREVEEFKMTDSFNEVSLGLPIILRGSVFFFSSFN